MTTHNIYSDKVLGIVGPTGVGKTALSIELAKQLNAEIISGDSMQVYRGMDIGTGKIAQAEMENIPHHLIDIKSPEEPFTVYEFQTHVRQLIREIHARNKVPLIVGGTGLYIQSVLYDYQFPENQHNRTIQQRLENEREKYGSERLYERLKAIDPTHAEKVHPNNYRRVIRALEVYEATGKTLTEHKSKANNGNQIIFPHMLIGLSMERPQLYDKINKRIDLMIQNGLIDEVYQLFHQIDIKSQAFQAIGYKEFIPYFNGNIERNEAIDLLKRNSRRYAKRQLTYFKNKLDVKWYDVTHQLTEEIFKKITLDSLHFLKNSH